MSRWEIGHVAMQATEGGSLSGIFTNLGSRGRRVSKKERRPNGGKRGRGTGNMGKGVGVGKGVKGK